MPYPAFFAAIIWENTLKITDQQVRLLPHLPALTERNCQQAFQTLYLSVQHGQNPRVRKNRLQGHLHLQRRTEIQRVCTRRGCLDISLAQTIGQRVHLQGELVWRRQL